MFLFWQNLKGRKKDLDFLLCLRKEGECFARKQRKFSEEEMARRKGATNKNSKCLPFFHLTLVIVVVVFLPER